MVKKVGSYLLDTVIPKFVQDLCSLDVSPMDGQTLTDVLHSNGINVRYLGRVSLSGLIQLKVKTFHCIFMFLKLFFSQIAGMIKHLPHLWDLFSAEIIVRSSKHVVKVLFLSLMLKCRCLVL